MISIIISFLGLIIGYFIASKTKEELNYGKKWFKIIISFTLIILILILILILIYLAKFNLIFIIGFILGVIINYLIKRIYVFLGLTLYLTFFTNNEIKLLLSLTLFIFGLAYGSLNYIKFKKISFKDILINFILFIMPFSLLLKENILNSNILIGGAIGGLLYGLFFINTRFKKEKRT